MISSILAAIVAIFKAVPILDSYFKQLIELYYNKKFEDISQAAVTKEKKVAVAAKCLAEAKTDDEAAVLFSILNNIRNGLQHH